MEVKHVQSLSDCPDMDLHINSGIKRNVSAVTMFLDFSDFVSASFVCSQCELA